ncbi:glycosyltransferase family 8 protein [Sporormia fimetaria CBS 119925]|uniref:Glycosyltransferase family 8 protein n=1 Tax=Sporormia fimetaria CBS 119925 TaxID=1340428 RepID=A0A6A6V887_9PLEO|nr:glycosyltransferase family 8 protein [Sporormia fimetaria CBS 119925]
MSPSLPRFYTDALPLKVAVILLFFIATSLFIHRESLSPTSLHKESQDKGLQPSPPDHVTGINPGSAPVPEVPNYAFAALLVRQADKKDDGKWDDDPYFWGLRILAYQLLHHSETRSDYPFVVFVSNDTSESKRDRLRKDGAVVKEVAPLNADWVQTTPNYAELFAKLRLWAHTEYDLLCLLDSDIVLAKSLGGLFDDPAVLEQKTALDPEKHQEEEGALPATYVFAAARETGPGHQYPPSIDRKEDYFELDHLNAGMMIFRPDKTLFEHYVKILSQEGKFNPQFPEQSLLNYAHRWNASMPWKPIGNTWNVNFPKMEDIEKGVASVHEKWWGGDGSPLKRWLAAWKFRAEGFFEALDLVEGVFEGDGRGGKR